jgi:hypothetical protein
MQCSEGEGKPGELMVGGSQLGKMEKEMGRKGREVVEMRGWVEIKGEWNEGEVRRVVEEVGKKGAGMEFKFPVPNPDLTGGSHKAMSCM